MRFDLDRLADGINHAWQVWGSWLVLAAVVATGLLVVHAIVKMVRSRQQARLVSTLTAVIVLAWTSEGLWEVARDTLGLPVAFAVMTFFVFEAMMITAGLQAEEHRRRYGTPGRAGRYVWVLAAGTATVVGLNSATLVEGALRLLLPLLAAGLWWVGITAPRESDTTEILARRAEEEQRQAATWAITPRTLLVRIGWMRPRAQTTTEAEQEYKVRRMVVHADRLQSAGPRSLLGSWAAHRLRRLARQASEADVIAVVDQVTRAAGIEALIRAIGADIVTPATPDTGADMTCAEADAAGGHQWLTSPPAGGGQEAAVVVAPRRTTTPDAEADIARTSPLGAGGRGPDVTTVEGADKGRRVLAILLHDPKLSRKDMAQKLGLSDRTVRRDINDLKILHGIPAGEDTDQQLVDALLSGGGQEAAVTPVNGADIAAFIGGGQGPDIGPAGGRTSDTGRDQRQEG